MLCLFLGKFKISMIHFTFQVILLAVALHAFSFWNLAVHINKVGVSQNEQMKTHEDGWWHHWHIYCQGCLDLLSWFKDIWISQPFTDGGTSLTEYLFLFCGFCHYTPVTSVLNEQKKGQSKDSRLCLQSWATFHKKKMRTWNKKPLKVLSCSHWRRVAAC